MIKLPTGRGTVEEQLAEIRNYLEHQSRTRKSTADQSYEMLDEIYRSLTEPRNDYDAASVRELWNKLVRSSGATVPSPSAPHPETDPVFSASAASGITSNDITAWNGNPKLFVVTVSLNSSYINVADKTFAEITQAYNNGDVVIAKRSSNIYVLTSITSTYLKFTSVDTTTSFLTITSSNNVTINLNYFLPSVNSNDNGKVLRVVNGMWQAAQLPSASGVSF